MPDASGQDKEKVEAILSSIQKLGPELAKAAAQGDQAFKNTLEKIHVMLSARINPEIEKMGKAYKPAMDEARKSLEALIKLNRTHYDIINIEENKKVQKIRDSYAQERKELLENFTLATKNQLLSHQQRIDLAKRAREELKNISKLESKDMAEAKQGEFMKSVKSAFSPAGVWGSAVSTLGPMVAIGSLLGRLQDIGIGEFKLGGAIGRATGQKASHGAGAAGLEAFGGFVGVGVGTIPPDKAAGMYAEALGKAPKLIGQSLEPALTPLLTMGVSVKDAMNLMAEASESAGLTVIETSKNIKFATGLAKAFGIDANRSLIYLQDFAGSIRRVGSSSEVAQKQSEEWTATIEEAAKSQNMSIADTSKLMSQVAGAIGSFSPSRAAGLIAGVTGKMPTTFAELEKAGTAGFAKQLYGTISRSAGAEGQMFVPEAFAKTLGMGNLDIQGAKTLQEAMSKPDMTMDRLKELGFQSMDSNMRDAKVAMVSSQSLLETIADIFAGEMMFIARRLGLAADRYLGPTISEDSPKWVGNLAEWLGASDPYMSKKEFKESSRLRREEHSLKRK